MASVWAFPYYERLQTSSQKPATPPQVKLTLARGEVGGFQVAVRGTSSSYQARVVALSPGLSAKVYEEVWTHTTRGAVHDYPDGLKMLPNPSVGQMIPASSARPSIIWVDVAVDRTAPAGELFVEVTLGIVNIRVPVTVLNFTVPEKPTLPSAIGTWPTNREVTVLGCRGNLAAEKLLLEHRLMPTFIDPTHAVELAALGQSHVYVGGYASMSGTSVTTPAPSAATVDSWIAKHQPLAPYSYLQDEEYSEAAIENLKNYSVNMVGKLKRMLTTKPTLDPDTDWLEVVCALPKFTLFSDTARRAGLGKETWVYQTLNQDSYSPKWLLDRGYAEHAQLGSFLAWAYGFTGLLYWRADYWKVGIDPWTNADGFVTSGVAFPGEAQWILPPWDSSASYAPTIRLKWMRDAMYIHDYLQMLKDMGSSYGDEVSLQMASNFNVWKKDDAVVANAKLTLAQEIDRLAKPKVMSRADSWWIGGTSYPSEEAAVEAAKIEAVQSGSCIVDHKITMTYS